jgi:methionine synthase II (cobalamin-independent)
MSSGSKNEIQLEHTSERHRSLAKGTAMNVLMPTTVVGSLPQPDWLVRKDVMLSSAPPRVRLKTIWRVEEPYLEEAQDDATAQAVRMQEAAGIDNHHRRRNST